ncbi:hypothetical protein ACTQX1_08250 [Collinsella bouchesdurhonensis]|uniref:hypothetical protein n=1 Tax=Bacillati TaxID=1783272 RepID=UPI003F8CDD74
MTDKQPRTLADMTSEELEQCRGMWCDLSIEAWIVVSAYYSEQYKQTLVVLLDPVDGELLEGVPATAVTPRFDLPRAWTPDGTPVVADPEEYTADGRSRVYFEGIEKVAFPPGTRVRRWVSDWEEIE